ncbi:hypothetical protein Tcan_04476 [Toxocara canis]|uniref:C-type lectin domain-containing protein n=1 Tax=Toxocara canis TaxID=6265 RepID=A0A0B2V7B3_TOXCA|nr:hypothetical protein Tcan_04476 [Toxocara canis]
MTKATLFVALTLCGIAAAASKSSKKCNNCNFVVASVEEDLRDLSRRLRDDLIYIRHLYEGRVRQMMKKLTQMTKEVNNAMEYCSRKKCVDPAQKESKMKKPTMDEIKDKICNAYNSQVPPADPKLRQFNIGFWFQPDGMSKWDDGTAYNKVVWPEFPENMPTLTNYSCVNLDLETVVLEGCMLQLVFRNYIYHAYKTDHGAIVRFAIQMPLEEYKRQGYVPTQQSTYYMRRNMCNAICQGTYVANVLHPSEIEPLREICNAYNSQVPPADPKLRQFNIGFWFQPDGMSKWDDGTAYNKVVWPEFPENMPTLTNYSCVNLDLETGKPVMGDCSIPYDVVVCEKRCVGLSIFEETFTA